MNKIYLEKIVFIVIFHLFICLLLSQLGLFLNFPITRFYYPLSVIISFLICRVNFISGVITTLILLFGFLISGYFFDLSADGQSYHQESIIQLKNGWNPIYFESHSRTMKVWTEHYPKGAEIIQSCIYSFFSKIETGKAINIFLLISSLLLSKKVLECFNINSKQQWIFAFLIAANPVVISQVLTFYVDGLSYSFFVCVLGSIFLFIKTKEKVYITLTAMALTIGGSLKFTSIPILVVLVLSILIILLFLKKISSIKTLVLPLLCTSFLLLFCNYNPYITNLKEGKHVFYPLKGEGSIDILERFAPEGFVRNNNRIEKLAFTLFTQTGSFDKDNMTYKIPFSVSQKELNRLADADIGVGGFGIFYSGFLIVLLLFFIVNYKRLKHLNNQQKILFISILPILASVLIISDPWWIRYIPQFYLIPLILLLILEVNNMKIKYLFILKGILFVNILFFFSSVTVLNIYGTEKTYYILEMLKNSKKPVKIDARYFPSNLDRLEEYGIPYKQIKIDDDHQPIIRFQPKGSIIIDDNFKKQDKNLVYGFLNRFFYKID
ncbi:hypothetical protein NAL32_01040 [Chryseobacterium sp. Ch-15]|uniref:Uncharacterized protein n=1 Tax=Chryseobacterium muglaense TaxID=2893752 RepID=A0A9Q3YVI2_9FLAO|nr:hypothetical protein [Chryseobacterium muglaense]MBD3903634.1 hypothetical protein [Chryseobacterium muglaense]MCC9034705.1 hypothetical protein [Chryseobacterium muglaense]MCM2552968.1 hypothetical protein [Chryseobacterium muglaense]